MIVGKPLAALAFGLITLDASADQFEMDMLETDNVRLLYSDPVNTYLVPYAWRSYENSLEFQENLFHWKPWEKPTLVLTDRSDYANASASESPTNELIVHIAPLSRTLETLPSAERTFSVMNHELVHIATLDGWNAQDARWRRFFGGGKPQRAEKHPETMLYNYLTTPRASSPRW